MMKYPLSILFFSFCFCAAVNAQKANSRDLTDRVKLRCAYLFSKKTPGAEKTFRRDTMYLDIGDQLSRFYDPARLGRDSLIWKLIHNTPQEQIKSMNINKLGYHKDLSGMPGTVSSDYTEGESYQIVKHKLLKTMTVFDYVSGFGVKYQYPDTLAKPDWQITELTDTIESYVCQKATLQFRGRSYVAWFTTEVPVSDGPWKFSGLPGLILKAEDAEGLFSFKLIGLMQPKADIQIAISTSDYLKCSRAELEKQQAKRGAGMQVNFTDGNFEISEVSGKYDALLMELK